MSEQNEQTAYILMAYSSDESWGPIAVITDKEEAYRTRDILNERMHGRSHDAGREKMYLPLNNVEHPLVVVHHTRLNPIIEDTRGKVIEIQRGGDEWMSLQKYLEWEDYYVDDPEGVWLLANGMQEYPNDYRISSKSAEVAS